MCGYDSFNAIVDVAKIFQKENKHIWIYASNFEEYRRFFVETLTEEAIIAIFLNNVQNALRFMLSPLRDPNLCGMCFEGDYKIV